MLQGYDEELMNELPINNQLTKKHSKHLSVHNVFLWSNHSVQNAVRDLLLHLHLGVIVHGSGTHLWVWMMSQVALCDLVVLHFSTGQN